LAFSAAWDRLIAALDVVLVLILVFVHLRADEISAARAEQPADQRAAEAVVLPTNRRARRSASGAADHGPL
jgi:hypothetical protein